MIKIKNKKTQALILFFGLLIVMALYPNKYTLTLNPLINFLFICYVFKDEIQNYDYNKYIKSEKFIMQIYWTFASASILQAIANILIKYTLHIEAPDISFAYQIVAAPIMSVCFSAINEEIIYRKLIFGELNNKFGFWISAIISSTIFMFSHYNYSAWFGYLIAGMVWSYVYKRTNNLAINIISHMLMNLSFFIIFTLEH